VAIKQKFALDADVNHNDLPGCAGAADPSAVPVQAVDVFNTCSWDRTDLVKLPQRGPLPVT